MTIETLIEKLSYDLVPAPAARPFVLFAKWLAVSILYVVILLFFGIRPDVLEKLQSPMFLTELGLLGAIAITSAISAALLSYPDILQKRGLVWLPVVPLLAFIGWVYVMWLHDNPPAPMPVHEWRCVLCVSTFTLLPAAWMIFSLRHQASTHYYLTGFIALIASSSLGCLASRLREETDSVTHLIQWHYMPVVGFGMIGLLLGRKFLKW